MRYGSVVRNTVLNFFGHVVPLVVGILAIPFIIRGLGVERFGILALAWAVLGTLTLFDLGLGRATTKFVAELIGKGETDRLGPLVWTSAVLSLLLGVVGAAALVLLTPLLIGRILNLSAEFVAEARASFYLIALTVPVVMGASPWSGVLEASQRYDLVNAVRVPTRVLNFLIPALALPFGLGLPEIITSLLLVRSAAAAAYLFLCFRMFPMIRQSLVVNSAAARLVFGYGRWVALSNALWPLLLNIDRFLIGALISVEAVGFYAAPVELATRLWIFPYSLVPLFPAFSTLGGERKDEVADLFIRANKHLLLVLGPVVVLMVLFAGPLLGLWLGEEFRVQCTVVLQILTVGVLAVSFASVAGTLTSGLGRPDITAKLHLIELPVYVLVAWVLIERWSIIGAAIAWTLRAVVDAFLMICACRKLLPSAARILADSGMSRAVVSLLALVFGIAGMAFWSGGGLLIVCSVAFLITFAAVSWRYVLDAADRGSIQAALGVGLER